MANLGCTLTTSACTMNTSGLLTYHKNQKYNFAMLQSTEGAAASHMHGWVQQTTTKDINKILKLRPNDCGYSTTLCFFQVNLTVDLLAIFPSYNPMQDFLINKQKPIALRAAQIRHTTSAESSKQNFHLASLINCSLVLCFCFRLLKFQQDISKQHQGRAKKKRLLTRRKQQTEQKKPSRSW